MEKNLQADPNCPRCKGKGIEFVSCCGEVEKDLCMCVEEAPLTNKVFKNYINGDIRFVVGDVGGLVYWIYGSEIDSNEFVHKTVKDQFIDKNTEIDIIEYRKEKDAEYQAFCNNQEAKERIHSSKLKEVADWDKKNLLFYVFGVIEKDLPQYQIDIINKEINYYVNQSTYK